MSNDKIAAQKETIILPVLPLRGMVLFPDMLLHFDVGRKKSMAALDYAMDNDQTIFFVTQKNIKENNPQVDDLYTIGVVAKVKQVLKQPGNVVRVLVEGLYRAKVTNFIDEDPFITAEIINCEKKYVHSQKREALVRKAKDIFSDYLKISPKMAPELILEVQSLNDAGKLSDYITSNIMIDYTVKQSILSELDATKRIEKLIEVLYDDLEILLFEEDINLKLKDRIDKNQKEYYLREQMKVISEELSEGDNPQTDAEKFRGKIKKLNVSDDIKSQLLEECSKLSKMVYGSQESNVIRTYLETCISLPWGIKTEDKVDINKAKEILDRDHYGLKDVKEKILDLLAVRAIKPDIKGQIICLVGPPGVGKTSIVKSIAEAVGRKYERIALGGVRDESEIRGHRRTYVGAMPGRIMATIKKAGVQNPLILLDEIDKLSKDFNGDPTSALLEALDPEQNSTFQDHYVDLPFDLSDVLFITTANDYSSIPDPLLDRMDVITLTSYTLEEKFEIAKRHLIPKQLKEHGVTPKVVSMTNSALDRLIYGYTKEAGVRELERVIISLIRKSIRAIVSNECDHVEIYEKDLEKFLGPEKYKRDDTDTTDSVGVVNGLAWTTVGGETMQIEVALMPGEGKLEITGSIGDVMKESAQIAVSYIRSNYLSLGIRPTFYKDTDIHIHVPEGAVPKDGPSAGIAITTAIVSALKNTAVKGNIAMTGEITLRGNVLPIGGLKEKTMAAYKANIKTVIIPSRNQPDLKEIDPKVLDNLKFIPVNSISEVLEHALTLSDINISKTNYHNSVTSNQNVLLTEGRI